MDKKFKVYIPKFEVIITARDEEDALEQGAEVYTDFRDQDPNFMDFKVKEIKKVKGVK
jgi:hypothetical protein